ncbi:hypothetical protein ACQCQP_22965 [Ralstonia pseudosolanacearum]|uniref:hypothetical protein n=1 Tax=Ralstonia pseudosolanacearum TaxID=1310165 RepID=UPI003CEA667F
MNNATPRQKYLYLLARLYELAAEFTDSDLKVIKDTFVSRDEPGVSMAIEAFMLLHGVQATQQTTGRSTKKRADDAERNAPPASVEEQEEAFSDRALFDLLGDESLFPRVQDIARMIPGDLPPQPKEGRSRYIRRAVRHVASLDASSIAKFRQNLTSELAKKPHNFISQWKNLIREL